MILDVGCALPLRRRSPAASTVTSGAILPAGSVPACWSSTQHDLHLRGLRRYQGSINSYIALVGFRLGDRRPHAHRQHLL